MVTKGIFLFYLFILILQSFYFSDRKNAVNEFMTNVRQAHLPETVSFLTGLNCYQFLGTSVNVLYPALQSKLTSSCASLVVRIMLRS